MSLSVEDLTAAGPQKAIVFGDKVLKEAIKVK